MPTDASDLVTYFNDFMDAIGDAVLDAVGQMQTLNAQIAVATGQQSSAMGEINSNISHIDQVASSIAAGVNASMTTADDLAVAALQQAVTRFRV